jgi:F0F1-type ATP synthase beta subunit
LKRQNVAEVIRNKSFPAVLLGEGQVISEDNDLYQAIISVVSLNKTAILFTELII